MSFRPETIERSASVARDFERVATRLAALEEGGGGGWSHALTSQSVAIPIDGTTADTGLVVTFDAVAGRKYFITWHQMIEHTSGSLNEIFETTLCTPNVSLATAVAGSGFLRAHYTGSSYLSSGQYVFAPSSSGSVTWRVGARAGTGVGAGRAWGTTFRQSSLVVMPL
jgi:hypothetical protein